MRVHNSYVAQIKKIYNKPQKTDSYSNEKPVKKDDGVDFSTEAGLFSVALNALRQLPEKKCDIDGIKDAVKSGTYKVSNQDVAEKILDENMIEKGW